MEESEQSYRAAVSHHEAGRLLDALALYDQALHVHQDFAKAHCARAQVLWSLDRRDEALKATAQAIASAPRFAEAYYNRAYMLQRQQRSLEALSAYDMALAIKPDFVEALNNRAGLLQSLRRYREALEDLDRVVAVRPQSASVYYNRGSVLLELEDLQGAQENFARAHGLAPDHPNAFGSLVTAAAGACDWDRVEELTPQMIKVASEGRCPVPPVIMLGQTDDPEMLHKCAKTNLASLLGEDRGVGSVASARMLDDGKRLRVAYISSDFGAHPVGWQIVGVIERHDLTRFDITGLSLGPQDGGPLRSRIMSGCDRFYDLSAMSDEAAAELIRQEEIQILVDLNGQTQGWRPSILQRRPAPVQVSYLGYTGTTASDFMDYVIADAQVLPSAIEPFYSERIARLPDSFWPPGPSRISTESSRGQNGLPEDAMVFCAFNNHHKINRSMFTCWMRILGAMPNSLLWLRWAPEAVVHNLRQAAAYHDVSPTRILFAPVVDAELHLGRHRLADLYLDTSPYNAHSSASDALCMGLPVLTLRSRSFAGRVASSMLHALALPELVTDTLEDYEALAIMLGRNKACMEELKTRLQAQIATAPFCDWKRYQESLEAAYWTMWSIARKGEEPQSFSV